jgi:hypothetical protein
MRILGKIIGDFYVAGLIISNISLIVACIFLYKLVRLDSDEKTALRSVKYLFLFPTAFIFSGVFSESLFLALLMVSFYYAKKRNWKAVGISGFFLSLTRSIGVLAIMPLLYEYLKGKDFKSRRVGADIFYLFLMPLGLLSFAAYSHYLTGDFLAYMNIEEKVWHRGLINPFKLFYYGILSTRISTSFATCYTILFLITLNIFYKKIGFSYWLLGMYSILIPLISTQKETLILSMPRFIMVIFPFFIIFSKLSDNHIIDQVLTIILVLTQGFLMVYWVFFLLII